MNWFRNMHRCRVCFSLNTVLGCAFFVSVLPIHVGAPLAIAFCVVNGLVLEVHRDWL